MSFHYSDFIKTLKRGEARDITLKDGRTETICVHTIDWVYFDYILDGAINLRPADLIAVAHEHQERYRLDFERSFHEVMIYYFEEIASDDEIEAKAWMRFIARGGSGA